MARFQQKYPFLKPSVTRLGGSALLNRILTEAKAGKNFFDVAHGTGEIVLPLMEMGLLAPYLSPERKMIPEDLKDKKGFWTSVYVNSVVLGYNTNLVKGQPISQASLQRFRCMTLAQRNEAVAKVLLGAPAPDVEADVLAYRAPLVTALREARLWPGSRGREIGP